MSAFFGHGNLKFLLPPNWNDCSRLVLMRKPTSHGTSNLQVTDIPRTGTEFDQHVGDYAKQVESDLQSLNVSLVANQELEHRKYKGKSLTFEFVPPGGDSKWLQLHVMVCESDRIYTFIWTVPEPDFANLTREIDIVLDSFQTS